MTLRTTAVSVTFNRPFSLSAMAEPVLPGTYVIETDEELLQGVSFPAYRRVSTRIHLTRPGGVQVVTVDPKDLERAIAADAGAAAQKDVSPAVVDPAVATGGGSPAKI